MEERPAPFQGKALLSATLTVVAYGQRLAAWMERVQREEEAPTSEQLVVLNRVTQRVLQEFRLEKEGLALDKRSATHRSRATAPRLLPRLARGKQKQSDQMDHARLH